MRYDTFLFTRDEQDYGWRQKPGYLPRNLYKTCRNLINLREKFPDWREEKWKKMIFGICIEGHPVIGRVIATNATDPFGRPVFSFEGVAVERITKRYLLDIASVIQYFNSREKNLRDDYLEGSLEASVEIDEINPLEAYAGFMGKWEEILLDNAGEDIYEEFSENREEQLAENAQQKVGKEIQMRLSAFQKMLQDIGEYELDYSFVYGEDAELVFVHIGKEFQVKKVYDTGREYEADPEAGQMQIFQEPVWWRKEEEKEAELLMEIVEIRKNAYGYRWIVKRKDSNIEVYTKVKKLRKEIALEVLREEERNLREYLTAGGYSLLDA